MRGIWSRQRQLRTWFRIQAYALEAMAQLNRVPACCAEQLWACEPNTFDNKRIGEIEAEVKHESLAFQMYLEELVGTPEARFIHHGLTSSDVLDTCLGYQLVGAGDLIVEGVLALTSSLRKKSEQYKHTLCIGRSHGVHAEPVTFGLKMARAYAEFCRNAERMRRAREEIAVGKISGAMGTFATVDPFVEEFVCKRLGLIPEPISSQIIPRDRHAAFFLAMALVAASLERLATELRHLHITEVAEVSEAFGAKQKGSSAMPHKRNPILSENVCGLARLVRSNCKVALDNVSLWHERDMTHSSVERAIAPDATTTLDFALWRMNSIVENLEINERQMQNNIAATRGRILSQRVLLLLAETGLNRDLAYRLVQSCATRSAKDGMDFRETLLAQPEIRDRLTMQRLDQVFDHEQNAGQVDRILTRVENAYTATDSRLD